MLGEEGVGETALFFKPGTWRGFFYPFLFCREREREFVFINDGVLYNYYSNNLFETFWKVLLLV